MTEQGTSLEIILVSMQAYVERCAAEMHDPETTRERVEEIVTRLRPIYEALKQLNQEIRAHAPGPTGIGEWAAPPGANGPNYLDPSARADIEACDECD